MSLLRRAVYALYGLSLVLVPVVKVGAVRRFGPAIQLSDLVFAAAAGLWFVGVLTGEFKLRLQRAYVATGLLVVTALVSLAATPSLRTSIVKLVGWGFLITLMVMTASLAETRRGFRFVVLAWLAGAGITAALGVVSAALFYAGVRDPKVNVWLWNYGSVPVGSYPRLAVWFENANMLCSYLVVSLAMVPAAWPFVASGWRKLLVVVGAAIAVVAMFTLSTGFGGMMLGAALFWILLMRHRKSVRPLRETVVGLTGAGAAIGFFAITVFLLVPKGEGDVPLGPVDLLLEKSGRVDTWAAAIDTYRAHPLTGAGLGVMVATVSNPRALYSMEYWGTDKMKGHESTSMEAHNIVLNVLGQTGLQGALAFVGLLGILVWGLLPRPGTSDDLDLPRIALFAGMVGAVFYHGLFAAIEESRQYWFLFGMVIAVRAQRDDDGRFSERGDRRRRLPT